jgi:hypothetical protein
MARTALTVQQIDRTAGIVPALAAVSANNNKFANDGRCFIDVANGADAPITVTFQTPGSVNGLAIADPAIAVANGVTRRFGPFEPGIFNQDDGMVYVDFSSPTTITTGVFRL